MSHRSPKARALRFQDYACFIDVSFWQLIIQTKLNSWKLECPPLLLSGSLECAATPSSRPVIRLDASSPASTRVDSDGKRGSILGCFYHVNTLEEFQSFGFSDKIAESTARGLQFIRQDGRCDINDLMLQQKRSDSNDEDRGIGQNMVTQSVQSYNDEGSVNWESLFQYVLNPFFIVAYMNLKQYSVIYCISCPSFTLKESPTFALCTPIASANLSFAEETPQGQDDTASMQLSTARSTCLCSSSEREPDVADCFGPAPISNVRYVTYRSAHSATKRFTANEIVHIGRHLKDLCCCHNSEQKRRSTSCICLLLKTANGKLIYYSLADILSLQLQALIHDNIKDVYLCVYDYSKSVCAVSWTTRNLLFTVCCLLKLYNVNLQLLCYREAQRFACSRIFYIRTPPEHVFVSGPVVLAGWLINRTWVPRESVGCIADLRGEMSVPANALFMLNLQSFLDSTTVQQEATELNVKLIKWRILPSFQPNRLKDLRFLIVGMGTLGCHIARDLVGWGVTKFTLVDCGTVSPSNPARQSLYLARDVATTPLKKVFVARDRLLDIRADLDIDVFDFEVPMPSQQRFLLSYNDYVGTTSQEIQDEQSMCYAVWVERRLRELIASHEVTLLLTDTRESRWLPSLISQSISYSRMKQGHVSVAHRLQTPFHPPLCITVALGFDTFVVIRHGSFSDALIPDEYVAVPYSESPAFRQTDVLRSRLSCYFCNDLSAPSALGSRYRTLDQQCTVTRTGVSAMASAVTVELISTMSQAAYGFGILPTDRRNELKELAQNTSVEEEKKEMLRRIAWDKGHTSCLGEAPHVIRGSVSTLNVASDWNANFERCVSCSAAVQEAYFLRGSKFVEEVIADAHALEITSGLHDLRKNDDIEVLVYHDDDDDDDGKLSSVPNAAQADS